MTTLDNLNTDILRLIYGLLPPIYCTQLALVCKTIHKAADPHTINIGTVIRSRTQHPYLQTIFDHGGYLVGDFLLDCLYNTYYHKGIDILFDIGFDNSMDYWDTSVDKSTTDGQEPALVRMFTDISQYTSDRLYISDISTVCTYDNGQTSKSLYKHVWYGNIRLRVITTDHGIDIYLNQCSSQFYKILYDGKRLIALYPKSLVKKHSVCDDKLATLAERSTDKLGNVVVDYTSTVADSGIVNIYTARGFTYSDTNVVGALH